MGKPVNIVAPVISGADAQTINVESVGIKIIQMSQAEAEIDGAIPG